MSAERLAAYQERIQRVGRPRQKVMIMIQAATDDGLETDELLRLDAWFKKNYPDAGKNKKGEQRCNEKD